MLHALGLFAQKIKTVVADRVGGVIYAPRCGLCQAELHVATPHALCADCWQTLPFLHPPLCSVCYHRLPPTHTDRQDRHPSPLYSLCLQCQQRPLAIDHIIAPFAYQEPITTLILQLKYGDHLALSHFLVPQMARLVQQQWLPHHHPHQLLLVPIPSHFWRLLKRQYNQAEVLARALSKATAIPIATNILTRTQPTSQKNQGADIRFHQLAHAFALNQRAWRNHKDKTVILIDDVVTTCATMHQVARLLKKNGAGMVYGLAVARTMLKH